MTCHSNSQCCQGDKGSRGHTGPTGSTGGAGSTGPTGPVGTGPTGAPPVLTNGFSAANLDVQQITTSDTVLFDDTASAGLFNLGGYDGTGTFTVGSTGFYFLSTDVSAIVVNDQGTNVTFFVDLNGVPLAGSSYDYNTFGFGTGATHTDRYSHSGKFLLNTGDILKVTIDVITLDVDTTFTLPSSNFSITYDSGT